MRWFAAIIFTTFFSIAAANAATETMVRGTVVDRSGHAVVGAQVQLGRSRAAVTDVRGQFAFEQVPSGDLVLIVSAERFS
ncbi:MAG TPA: carboxypeptidase-like regulatory domain-containing protein, partial [Thermoanaerobaculia bacterium]